MEAGFDAIENLSVHHDRRDDLGGEPWDSYVVTIELRTFLVSLGPIDEDRFGATIRETAHRRGLERERYRASTEAATWHEAYAHALTSIITGVVTGDWSDEPPLDLLRFPSRSP